MHVHEYMHYTCTCTYKYTHEDVQIDKLSYTCTCTTFRSYDYKYYMYSTVSTYNTCTCTLQFSPTSSILSPILRWPSWKAGPPLLMLFTYIGISSVLVATSRDARPKPNVPLAPLVSSIVFLTPSCLVLVDTNDVVVDDRGLPACTSGVVLAKCILNVWSYIYKYIVYNYMYVNWWLDISLETVMYIACWSVVCTQIHLHVQYMCLVTQNIKIIDLKLHAVRNKYCTCIYKI